MGEIIPLHLKAVVFDIDNTLYIRSDDYFNAGNYNELVALAEILNRSFEETAQLVNTRRAEIAARNNRTAALTETVYSLGITPKQWSDLRCIAWQPEKWVQRDPEICAALMHLAEIYMVVFATNSPAHIGRLTIQALGIQGVPGIKMVLGPEDVGYSKPNPNFFACVAGRLCLEPSFCISIGDRGFSDGSPALQAGYMGAIIVPNSRNETLLAISDLITRQPTIYRRSNG